MRDAQEMTSEDTAGGQATVARDTAIAAAALRARHPMEILLKNAGTAFLKPGDIAEGTVIEKRRGTLYVDLGPKGTGIVFGREYKAAEDVIKPLKSGDTISAKIVELDNDQGYVELAGWR